MFILLFSALNEVTLTEERQLFGSGLRQRNTQPPQPMTYSFLELFSDFKTSLIWKAKTEPKCWFFVWLAIQGKASTADNLLRKN
jgi:hypothetical protein